MASVLACTSRESVAEVPGEVLVDPMFSCSGLSLFHRICCSFSGLPSFLFQT